jgi:hypothetical protein
VTIEKGLVIVPIVNFVSEDKLIKFDKTLSIRHIDSNTFETLLKRTGDSYLNLKKGLADVEFVIEKKIAKKAEEIELSLRFGLAYQLFYFNDISNVSLALKLMKKGDIALPIRFFVSPNFFHVSNTDPVVRDFTELYYLPKKYVSETRRLWYKLKNVAKERPHLDFSLNQFSRTFHGYDYENGLVDLMTAFESIVFSKGKGAPKPYGQVIGIAIGMFIGRNEEERTKIRSDLEEAYSLRNKIVHGHLRDLRMERANEIDFELHSNIREYLRETLRKLLEEVKT